MTPKMHKRTPEPELHEQMLKEAEGNICLVALEGHITLETVARRLFALLEKLKEMEDGRTED